MMNAAGASGKKLTHGSVVLGYMMKIIQDLYIAREWYLAHRSLGLWPDWREFKRIKNLYGGQGRHYHTFQHIYECLRFVRRHYGFQPLLVFALIYHDVLYNVRSKTNERDSAVFWVTYARLRGIDRHNSLKVKMVEDLILMTAKHTVDPGSPLLFKMMSDADMHVFLCPDAHYLQYARNIWREYSEFGQEAYIKGRLDFLSTVDPKTMFYTHQARALSHHARANLDLERTILEQNPEQIIA
jgi:predicted metal-dependent HD superfamily phosphohydrolase